VRTGRLQRGSGSRPGWRRSVLGRRDVRAACESIAHELGLSTSQVRTDPRRPLQPPAASVCGLACSTCSLKPPRG